MRGLIVGLWRAGLRISGALALNETGSWTPPGVRGVRRRFAPHQLRHAHAVEMSREGIPLLVIQRQLGYADLAIRSAYLRGIDDTEVIQVVHDVLHR